MADYNESVVPGTITTWQRCARIQIQNPYNDSAAINVRFEEEIIKLLPDGEVIKSALVQGGITKEFDPEIKIALRNPTTWELTGETTSMGAIMAALGSAYWQFALERDSESA